MVFLVKVIAERMLPLARGVSIYHVRVVHPREPRWAWWADSDKERRRHDKSDFRKYVDSQNRYTDFHSNRHPLIANPSLPGQCPRDAREQARHRDVRLTVNVYTHVGLDDNAKGIRKLDVPGEEAE